MKAFKGGASIELFLCNPNSKILKFRSVSAHRKEPERGSTIIRTLLQDLYEWSKESQSGKFNIVLYDCWPGNPIISFDDEMWMGLYLIGDPSPEWPWIKMKEGTYMSIELNGQFEKISKHPETIELSTRAELEKWLIGKDLLPAFK